MNENSQLIARMFAPWNEQAWDTLRDQYPEAVAAVLAGVAAGVGPEDIRRYAEDHGYLPHVSDMLAQAAAYAQLRADLPESPDDPPEATAPAAAPAVNPL